MEKIHVTVRTRRLSPEDDKTSPWRISGNSISNPNHSSKFEFERIFGESCKTQEVYEARTKNIVAAAVCGFNGTVFAYGQTNNGKTHTIRGSTAEPGVIPRAVHDLFGLIQEGPCSLSGQQTYSYFATCTGGKCNTAIICNITLAQIHADETKSCLQFASRALRVTNCACVNEILTDAALLKRQKKEIEELKHKISLLEVSNAELKGELQEIRIAFEHLAQRGLDAQVEKTAGLCCTCSRHSLCQTTMCRCRAGGGSCGVSCGCLSYRCLNR